MTSAVNIFSEILRIEKDIPKIFQGQQTKEHFLSCEIILLNLILKETFHQQ
jgi:hypothetical protein